MQKYFDIWQYEDIKKVMNYDIVAAKNKCEIYIQKYPEDYFSKLLYANILINFGEIDTAKKIIKSTFETAYNDPLFVKEKVKVEGLIDNINLCKLRMLGYECKYEQAYDFLMSNNKLIKKFDLCGFMSFLIYHLNKIEVNDRLSLPYVFRQSYDYQNNDFLEHVSKHLYNENSNLSEAVFIKDFPFDEILAVIRKNFTKYNSLFSGLWTDKYIFKFDNCGKSSGKYVDFFEVVCIHNTFNIITMFPSIENKSLCCDDLSYLNIKNISTKKLSQIDKFNKRYNIK